MLYTSYLNKKNPREIEEITNFLGKHQVVYDYPEISVVIRDRGKIIASGSCEEKVIKYLFIDEEYKGQGLMVDIYNKLLDYLLDKGRLEHFVFTQPKNKDIFTSIGLREVISTEDVLLLEGGFASYEDWMTNIKELLDPGVHLRGSIVANCNPMTLGHKYLIDVARDQVDELVVFIVEEDKSYFSTDDRYNIVKEELKGYKDTIVVLGGPYIISQATFPTYFLKEEDDKLDIYTSLDAKLFAQRISKDLDIDYRFVGQEPADNLTRKYNYKMKEVFENYPIELKVIERKKQGGQFISASKVRAYLDQGEIEKALKFVPQATKKLIITGEYNEKNN